MDPNPNTDLLGISIRERFSISEWPPLLCGCIYQLLAWVNKHSAICSSAGVNRVLLSTPRPCSPCLSFQSRKMFFSLYIWANLIKCSCSRCASLSVFYILSLSLLFYIFLFVHSCLSGWVFIACWSVHDSSRLLFKEEGCLEVREAKKNVPWDKQQRGKLDFPRIDTFTYLSQSFSPADQMGVRDELCSLCPSYSFTLSFFQHHFSFFLRCLSLSW